jgi:hypothetical protein
MYCLFKSTYHHSDDCRQENHPTAQMIASIIATWSSESAQRRGIKGVIEVDPSLLLGTIVGGVESPPEAGVVRIKGDFRAPL